MDSDVERPQGRMRRGGEVDRRGDERAVVFGDDQVVVTADGGGEVRVGWGSDFEGG